LCWVAAARGAELADQYGWRDQAASAAITIGEIGDARAGHFRAWS
jgi:hypothetical protein